MQRKKRIRGTGGWGYNIISCLGATRSFHKMYNVHVHVYTCYQINHSVANTQSVDLMTFAASLHFGQLPTHNRRPYYTHLVGFDCVTILQWLIHHIYNRAQYTTLPKKLRFLNKLNIKLGTPLQPKPWGSHAVPAHDQACLCKHNSTDCSQKLHAPYHQVRHESSWSLTSINPEGKPPAPQCLIRCIPSKKAEPRMWELGMGSLKPLQSYRNSPSPSTWRCTCM